MLSIQNLHLQIESKSILNGVNCDFEVGKNYCLLGKNGSGKSSLALGVMGHPSYHITEGDIVIDGQSIKDLSPHERAKKGVFLAFQTIPEIKGVKLFEFLRTIYSEKIWTNQSFLAFKKVIEPLLEELGIDKEFLRRDLNVGFSGGEKRKIEILQLRLLEPMYIFLDEVDSGLDVDAFRSVAQLIQSLNSEKNCFIIITHYFSILDYVPVDRVYILEQGKIVKQWLSELAHEIKEKGFNM